MKKLEKMILLSILITFSACSGGGDSADGISPLSGINSEELSDKLDDLVDESSGNELAEEVVDDSVLNDENEKESIVESEVEVTTVFKNSKGYCVNKDSDEKELINTNKLKDCADLGDLNLEEYDLEKEGETYFGANMKGSDLRENKVPYEKISWFEVDVDENTLFPLEGKSLIDKLKKSHKLSMDSTGKEKSKRNKTIKELQKENQKIKKRLQKEKKTLTDEEFKSLSVQYNDNKKKIAELKLENKDLNRKKSRHKNYIKKIVKW